MPADPCILVIDDDVEICSFLNDLLASQGYTVFTATDPEKGLRMVKKLRPDVVFLDLKMPRMDGIEVLGRIKKITEDTEVIVITGFGTMDTAKSAMRLGAFDYITKPFDLAHVKALVQDALAFRIGRFIGELKPGKAPLSDKDLAFLESIRECRPEGACVWEVAIRAVLLGDAAFMNEWMETPGIGQEDKRNLALLTKLLNNVIRREGSEGGS